VKKKTDRANIKSIYIMLYQSYILLFRIKLGQYALLCYWL